VRARSGRDGVQGCMPSGCSVSISSFLHLCLYTSILIHVYHLRVGPLGQPYVVSHGRVLGTHIKQLAFVKVG